MVHLSWCVCGAPFVGLLAELGVVVWPEREARWTWMASAWRCILTPFARPPCLVGSGVCVCVCVFGGARVWCNLQPAGYQRLARSLIVRLDVHAFVCCIIPSSIHSFISSFAHASITTPRLPLPLCCLGKASPLPVPCGVAGCAASGGEREAGG